MYLFAEENPETEIALIESPEMPDDDLLVDLADDSNDDDDLNGDINDDNLASVSE